MINFCVATNKWRFDVPNHNINNGSVKPLIYNQLFVNNQLHVLNTNTGILYTNEIDLDMIDKLKQCNFGVVTDNRLRTTINDKTTYIHELVVGIKTNNNYVINHIDGDYTNNTSINLELITQWLNTVLVEKNLDYPFV
jgi:hypothetical protein